jgi:TonB-dependent receptor
MNKRYNKILFILSILLITASQLYAAGRVTGYVFDSQYNEPLPGANVYLDGTRLGASTDLNGKYLLPQVPAGSYTMVITYIGYQEKRVDITVADNQELQEIITLDYVTMEGEVIEVTAQAEGQMQAINQQLASDKIANIVSEAKIQELPDFNAASALSRLPGVSTTQSSGEDNKVVIRGLSPKYNSIEIEGVSLSATGSSNIGEIANPNFGGTPGLSNDRSVDLTMVSPYMIRTIAVYKSLTPDMNANSIGGTVNMELREAPADPHFDLLWQTGYTAKSGNFGNYRAVASGSNRFFNERFGIYALLNIESYDRDADNMNADYGIKGDETTIDSATGYRPVAVNTVTFNRHIESRDRFGANLIMDYNLSNGSLKFVNMFARLNSDYIDHNQSIQYNNGDVRWQMRQGENITDQQLHSLRLDYDLDYVNMDLSANYTAANNVLDNSPVLNFNYRNAVKVNGGVEFYNVLPEDLVELLQYNDFGGDSSVVLRNGNLFINDYREEKLSFKADFEFPFNIGTAAGGFIKIGGQITNQTNKTDQETPFLNFDGAADINEESIRALLVREIRDEFNLEPDDLGNFTGLNFKNNDGDLYDPFLDDDFGDFFYASDPVLLKQIMNYIASVPELDAATSTYGGQDGRSGGWYNSDFQKLANDYKYEEDYYAAYAMTKIEWLDFMIIGGIRYEQVDFNYFAWNGENLNRMDIQKMYDTTAVNSNDFILPMGQVKYSPFNWMDVRYAYTQTLARPDYQHLSPKFTLRNGGGSLISGNPDLKPAQAFNHDINFTFHANKLGLLTVGGFYKTIDDFVYTATYQLDLAEEAGIDAFDRYVVYENGAVAIDPNTTATVTRPINNPFKSIVKGVELDFQHNFWYLPAPFNSMVFGINYARIYSESKYPFYDVLVTRVPGSIPPRFETTLIDSSFNGRLIDQPNHVLNTYIGYDYKGFSTRLSILFQDNSNRNNGGQFPENDSFTEEYFRLDFSAKQKLPWYNSELFLDIINLNSQNNSWIQKSTGGFQGIQNYGLTANLGVRFRY